MAAAPHARRDEGVRSTERFVLAPLRDGLVSREPGRRRREVWKNVSKKFQKLVTGNSPKLREGPKMDSNRRFWAQQRKQSTNISKKNPISKCKRHEKGRGERKEGALCKTISYRSVLHRKHNSSPYNEVRKPEKPRRRAANPQRLW